MLSWFTVITLMVEAARVIEMRLRLIALGRGGGLRMSALEGGTDVLF